jgi:hypothetical protein
VRGCYSAIDSGDAGAAIVEWEDEKRKIADSDEAGHAFQYEAGHLFRSEAGQCPDLMSATGGLLPQIEVMMFGSDGLVKRLGWR